MGSSFEIFADPQAALRSICVTQIIVSLSALASTAALLMQVVPAMLGGMN